MRKAFTIVTGCSAILLIATLVVSAATRILLTVDINTVGGVVVCGGTCSSFNPQQPGSWAGEYGGGAVTAFPGDPDPAGYVSFAPKHRDGKTVRIRHLDGLADDSFDLCVKDASGAWIKVGHYEDFGGTSDGSDEQWVTSTFSLKRDISGKRVVFEPSGIVDIKIEPTALGWSGFGTWGQLAIDRVELMKLVD